MTSQAPQTSFLLTQIFTITLHSHGVSDTRALAAQACRAHGTASQRTAAGAKPRSEPQCLAEPTTHDPGAAADELLDHDGRPYAVYEFENAQTRECIVECIFRSGGAY